jgi:hypothetical protein
VIDMKLKLVCAAIVVPVLALVACNPGQSSGEAKANKSDQADGTVTFPANFPSYVSIYPKAIPFNNPAQGIANTMMKGMLGDGAAMTTFATTDTSEAVFAYYKSELEKAGLVADELGAGGDPNTKSYLKSEPEFEGVTIVTTKLPPDKTMVQVIVFKDVAMDEKK